MMVIGLRSTFLLKNPFSSSIRAQMQREMEIIFIATPTEITKLSSLAINISSFP